MDKHINKMNNNHNIATSNQSKNTTSLSSTLSLQQLQEITTLMSRNNKQEAINFCNELLIQNPMAPDVYNILGILFAQENNLKQSIAHFEKAIQQAPNDATYYNNLSNAFKKQGNLQEARKCLHHAINLSPNYAEAYNNLGSLYYTEGRLKDAITYFKKAIRLSPNYWEPHYNLANSLIKEDLINNAISHYQTALEIKPSHVKTQQNLAMAYVAAGKLIDALPYLEKIIQYNPEHPELHAQLAEAYLETGKTAEAIIMLEKALDLTNNQPTWHHNLAILYLREQNKEQALLHFKKSLQQDPANQTAKHMINALSTQDIQNAPVKYVVDLFDQYAQFYNKHVSEALEYKVPELLRKAIGKHLQANLKTMNVLDLGCGTGLCSIYFRDLAQYLVGIDASAEMLTQAKGLKAYDALCRGNILQFIPGINTSFFNLIIAADVLVYCGKLDELFSLCYQALAPNGMFAFTVEHLASGDYQLQKTGRFAHSANYIAETAEQYNFTLSKQTQITLRKNNDKPITGMLFILTK